MLLKARGRWWPHIATVIPKPVILVVVFIRYMI